MVASASPTVSFAAHVGGVSGAQELASARAFGRIVGSIAAISGVLVELVLLGVLVRPGAVAG